MRFVTGALLPAAVLGTRRSSDHTEPCKRVFAPRRPARTTRSTCTCAHKHVQWACGGKGLRAWSLQDSNRQRHNHDSPASSRCRMSREYDKSRAEYQSLKSKCVRSISAVSDSPRKLSCCSDKTLCARPQYSLRSNARGSTRARCAQRRYKQKRGFEAKFDSLRRSAMSLGVSSSTNDSPCGGLGGGDRMGTAACASVCRTHFDPQQLQALSGGPVRPRVDDREIIKRQP